MVGAEAAQRALAGVDVLVELVDQRQARGHRRGPRLAQPQPREQVAAAGAEQVAVRVRNALLEEDRVDAVRELRCGA